VSFTRERRGCQVKGKGSQHGEDKDIAPEGERIIREEGEEGKNTRGLWLKKTVG